MKRHMDGMMYTVHQMAEVAKQWNLEKGSLFYELYSLKGVSMTNRLSFLSRSTPITLDMVVGTLGTVKTTSVLEQPGQPQDRLEFGPFTVGVSLEMMKPTPGLLGTLKMTLRTLEPTGIWIQTDGKHEDHLKGPEMH